MRRVRGGAWWPLALVLCAAAPPPELAGPPLPPEALPHSPSTRGLSLHDERALRLVASRHGAVGLNRVTSADFGRKGLLRFSASFEATGASSFLVPGNRMARVGASMAVAYVPVDFAEFSAVYDDAAVSNTAGSPGLTHTQGDFRLLARMGFALPHRLWLGAGMELAALSPPTSLTLGDFAFGLAPWVYFTAALPKLPTVRLHANAGVLFDGSGQFADPSSPLSTFMYRSQAYSRTALRLGGQWALPWLTPFAEVGLQLPLSALPFSRPDGRPATLLDAAQTTAAAGVQWTSFDDLTFTATAEFGLFRNAVLGIPSATAVNVVIAARYTADTKRPPVVLVDKPAPAVVQAPPPRPGDIQGVVVDSVTHQPVGGALLTVRTGTPVASDPTTGAFLTQGLKAGPTRVVVEKEGYISQERQVEVVDGTTTQLELALVALPKRTRLTVHVEHKRKPIEASVLVHGEVETSLTHPAAGSDGVRAELAPGLVAVDVSAPGYLAQTRELALKESQPLAVMFELVPTPKKSLVVVTATKIQILQKIHFDFNAATIKRDSFGLLNEVVAAIVTHQLPFVRIEGYTDSVGPDEYNQKLSEARAQSVMAFLVRAGVSPNRLSAHGFGERLPLDTNETATGRETNRRVEFVIVREPASPAAP